jgi:putative membrane protein
MRKLTLIPVIALAVGLFQACSGNKSSSTTDSSVTKTDSSKITTVKTDSTAAANPDSTFTRKAAVGGMAEVALAKLALSKTSNAKIKEFANMMVTDHGKANDELKGIAKTKNVMLPASVDAEHQQKMDDLSTKSGSDFDKAYVSAMVDGHKKTLDLMKDEAANGKDADFKAFAAKTAPVVQMHLDAINKISNNMK